MRFLVRCKMSVDGGNAFVRDPNWNKKIEQIMGDIKPEAAYFTVDGGQRTVYLVVNLADAHRIPAIAEPLWLTFRADVDFIPAMNQEDFVKAAPLIEQAVKKY